MNILLLKATSVLQVEFNRHYKNKPKNCGISKAIAVYIAICCNIGFAPYCNCDNHSYLA